MKVSHSRIECFKKCPFQYKLKYIDKLKTYFNGDPANPLIIGTALHTGIEKSIEEAIEWYYSQYPVINDNNIEEAIKLEAVIKKCKALIPTHGEYELKIECAEFIGFIDLLVEVEPGVYDLYDFKYSNNVESYLKSGQLHEYKFYFEQTHQNKFIRDMYFLFAPKVAIKKKYKNKTNKRYETLEEFRQRLGEELKSKEAQLIKVEYNPKKVEEFLQDAQKCRTARTFDKNPTRLCDWCEFKDYCMKGETTDIMNLPENKRRTIESNDKKKLWIYGAPFSGKTYLANQFPEPLMLNTDGNIKYVDAPYVAIRDEVKTEGRLTKRTFAWQVFKDTIAELEKKQNTFKTIIVDLLEDTYESCRLYMYDQLGITHESDDPFKAWDKIRIEFLSTIKRLCNLDYENIILISHEDTSKDLTKKGGDKLTAIKPNINDKAALKIAGMVDLVCRVIDDEGKRVISFKNNEVIFGGGRLGIVANEIPSSYKNLVEIYHAHTLVNASAPAPVVEKAKEELPKRKVRTTPTEHEKKVEEFKEEHKQVVPQVVTEEPGNEELPWEQEPKVEEQQTTPVRRRRRRE